MSQPQDAACPLLLPSDHLRLAADVVVHGGSLQDRAVGAQHQLHGAGVVVARQLQMGCSFNTLKELAKQHTIHPANVCALLGFLNTTGALRVRRPLRNRISAGTQLLQSALLGIRFAAVRRRYPASVRGVAVAVLRATLPVVMAVGVTALLCGGANIGSADNDAIIAVVASTIFVCSIVAHELSHLQMIKKYGARAAVVQAGMHIVLIRRKLSTAQEMIVAVAGPAGGIAVCLGIAVTSLLQKQQNITWIAIGTALLHLLSLLPIYSDGKNSWAYLFHTTITSKENA